MPVNVRGHMRRNPNAPKTLDPAQVYIVPPDSLQTTAPIPKRNRLKAIRHALRPKRLEPVRTKMDDLADEADQIANIIDGLGTS